MQNKAVLLDATFIFGYSFLFCRKKSTSTTVAAMILLNVFIQFLTSLCLFFCHVKATEVGYNTYRTSPDSLKVVICLCFRVNWLSFAADFLSLLLVRSHQVEIINYREESSLRAQQRDLVWN